MTNGYFFIKLCLLRRHFNAFIKKVSCIGCPNFWTSVSNRLGSGRRHVARGALCLSRGETAADGPSVYVEALAGSPHSFWRRGTSSRNSAGDWERAFPSSVNSSTATMIKKFDKKDEESGKRERSRGRETSALFKEWAALWRLLG